MTANILHRYHDETIDVKCEIPATTSETLNEFELGWVMVLNWACNFYQTLQ